MRVRYNWFYTNQEGEEFQEFEVGKNNCTKIEFHCPRFGQSIGKSFIEAFFKDGTKSRIYNFSEIHFAKKAPLIEEEAA